MILFAGLKQAAQHEGGKENVRFSRNRFREIN
jgi:hypothetical protein